MPVSKKRKNAGKGKNSKTKPIILDVPSPHLKLQMVGNELKIGKKYAWHEVDMLMKLSDMILDLLGVSDWVDEYEDNYKGAGMPVYKIANIKSYLKQANIDLQEFANKIYTLQARIDIMRFFRNHKIMPPLVDINGQAVGNYKYTTFEEYLPELEAEMREHIREYYILLINTGLKIIEVMYKQQHVVCTEEAIKGFIVKLRQEYNQYIPDMEKEQVESNEYFSVSEVKADGFKYPTLMDEDIARQYMEQLSYAE